MTNFLLGASRVIKGNIIIVLAVIIGLVIIWKQYSNSEKGQMQLQKFIMKIPVAGSMVVKSSTAKFSLSLSTLLHNGVPLDQALDIPHVRLALFAELPGLWCQQRHEALEGAEGIVQLV